MKERLDILLVNKGLAPSREKAKAMIMEGNVFVDNNREDKAGSTFDVNANIEVKGNTLKYVSRGGLKLEKAMTHFGITLEGKVCMDIGASTGGFTDCMLQNGAVKVYAVDVGYGQFAWKLRQDERVVCMEKTNIRYVKPEDIADRLDFASVEEVIHKVIDHAVEIGFHILNLEYSPIKGPEGNIEYLVYIRKEAEGSREESVDVHAVVEAAHGELDK